MVKYLVAVAVALGVTLGFWLFLRGGPSCDSPSYPDQTSSAYVLPYPVGETHNVRQGNCTLNTHNREYDGDFAYDFEMPIGSSVVASRGGDVLVVQDHFSDSDHDINHGNYVVIGHSDGTYATYGHITQLGALVRAGATVAAGDLIARSGNSGLSRGPHLHFQVDKCRVRVGDIQLSCHTIPVVFRNTRPHPRGLQGSPTFEIGGGEWYQARAR